MTTLADKSLLSGGDNKPPMLEKHLYDSWKSIMELYMMNRPHGRMILACVEKGPLVWPTITVEGATRPKEYTELTTVETIQADCNIKAINIILQVIPPEIYALQERECKLYNEFDKFTYKTRESLHEYYLRFTLLLNDMNIYKMPLEQFQVNTKFLNTLPTEWRKFVTDVKLVKDLHTTNVDQIHAHLEHKIAEDLAYDALSFASCIIIVDRARGFPAQSIRSSNAIALDSPYLLVLITEMSQSRQHRISQVTYRRAFVMLTLEDSIVIVNTKEYHSDVLAIITRIMRRTLDNSL
ncbi:hypothetical protein Tco_1547517 [Tanacetum coccineum]